MSKNSSWYRLNMFNKNVASEVMFGPTDFKQTCWLYPTRMLKKNSTIIWIPSKKIHIGIASYIDAIKNNDTDSLNKLIEIGIPTNINFGYNKNDDLTSTYTEVKEKKQSTPKKKKVDSVKVMRAQFGSTYSDGTAFRAGDIVKILFRKKFVSDDCGKKSFVNVYEKPSDIEIAEFLKTESTH